MTQTSFHLTFSDPELAQVLSDAIQSLDRAQAAPPLEIQLETSRAEKSVVQARNHLIDLLRKDPGAPDSGAWKDLLVQLNQALSLIVGVEYPSNYARREMITQAKDVLEGKGK